MKEEQGAVGPGVGAVAAVVPESEISGDNTLRPLVLRRAVMAWLLAQGVYGLATKTPTRLNRFRADVAAFWHETTRGRRGAAGPRQLVVPGRTLIVECRPSRQECWPEVSNSADLLPELRRWRQQAADLERVIREQEPELRSATDLFPEYSEWDYARSQNPDYQQVRRELQHFESALYQGSRFEMIASAGLADLLYLAVPEKAVHPHELAEGWGLLWVNEQLEVRLVQPARERQCQPAHRLHLVQNIAAAALPYVLFAYGIYHEENDVRFLPIPRRRRRSRRGTAED